MKKYFTKEHLERGHVSDYVGGSYAYTLGRLKQDIDKLIESGISLDTIVAIEHIENEMLEAEGNGWNIVDYLWESQDIALDPAKPEEKETVECYSRSIVAFQLVRSRDEHGNLILVVTPHY